MSSSDDQVLSSLHPNSLDGSNISTKSSFEHSRLNVSLEGEFQKIPNTLKLFEKKEDYFFPQPLDLDTAKSCLKDIGKITTGESYAYLSFEAQSKQLVDVSVIVRFPHLKNVNLSGNLLDDEAVKCLEKLSQIQQLNLSMNNLKTIPFRKMPYLNWLNISHNDLKCVNNFFQPELRTLIASRNEIEEVMLTHNCLPNLKFLDLSHNLIKTLTGINTRSLKELYVGYNNIDSFDKLCLASLQNLQTLHLRENRIQNLNEFEKCCKKLEYLNLRSNQIANFRTFNSFSGHRNITTLILSVNPIMTDRNILEDQQPTEVFGEQEEDLVQQFRSEVLAFFPNLKRLNKHVLTTEEKTNAMLESGDNLLKIFNREIVLSPMKYMSESELSGRNVSLASSYEEEEELVDTEIEK